MRIYLVGFMGSGKSTMGSTMARKLNCDFVDLDHYIVENEGLTIPEIFSNHGEEYFRVCEQKYLRQIGDNQQNIVISTGGGTPTKGDNMAYMRATGVVVYLKLEPAMLRDRLLSSKTVRPLIAGKSPDELLAYIETTLAEREKYYTQANLVVANPGRDADRIIEMINYTKKD